MKSDRALFYFGCIRQTGHYLWATDTGREGATWIAEQLHCGLNLIGCLDGTFCPPYGVEGYQESIVPPVRIVAWWDRTVDKRPNSNSVLIGYGFDTADEMLDAAMTQFPSVMNRQPRPLPTAGEKGKQ